MDATSRVRHLLIMRWRIGIVAMPFTGHHDTASSRRTRSYPYTSYRDGCGMRYIVSRPRVVERSQKTSTCWTTVLTKRHPPEQETGVEMCFCTAMRHIAMHIPPLRTTESIVSQRDKPSHTRSFAATHWRGGANPIERLGKHGASLPTTQVGHIDSYDLRHRADDHLREYLNRIRCQPSRPPAWKYF